MMLVVAVVFFPVPERGRPSSDLELRSAGPAGGAAVMEVPVVLSRDEIEPGRPLISLTFVPDPFN